MGCRACSRQSFLVRTEDSRIASDGIASRIHTADIVDCIVAVSATPKLELEKILTIDNLVSFLTTLESSESESLLQHLPEEHETLFDEVRSLRIHQRGSETTTYLLTHVPTQINSAQFLQAVESFGAALRGGQIRTIFVHFGLNPSSISSSDGMQTGWVVA